MSEVDQSSDNRISEQNTTHYDTSDYVRSNHLLYPDFIRCVGIMLIMIIHVGAGAFYSFSDKWTAANLFDSFSRIGVPLFFMLSGALLIGKDEPLHVFFQKRFIKV